MKRVRRWARRFGKFLKDLFYGTDNIAADLARILAFVGVMSMIGGLAWNIHLGKEIDLGPGGLGGGMAAVLTAAGAYLAAKEWSKKKARESAAIAQNTAVAKDHGEPVVEVAPPALKPSAPVQTKEAK